MAHPDLRWYCGECGYPRTSDVPHTCPPDAEGVVRSLVDALPSNAPPPTIAEEIRALSESLRHHRPDAWTVSADALRWLLAGHAYLETAKEKLQAHKAILKGKG